VGFLGLQLRNFTTHFHRLRHVADLQLRFDAHRLVRSYRYVAGLIGLEPGCLHAHFVSVRNQVRDREIAVLARYGLVGRALGSVGYRHLRAYHRRSLSVAYVTNDAAVDRLPLGCRCIYHQRQAKSDKSHPNPSSHHFTPPSIKPGFASPSTTAYRQNRNQALSWLTR